MGEDVDPEDPLAVTYATALPSATIRRGACFAAPNTKHFGLEPEG